MYFYLNLYNNLCEIISLNRNNLLEFINDIELANEIKNRKL